MTEMARLPMPTMYTLYAVLDGAEIIYIGRTSDLARRIAEHRSTSRWFTKDLEFVALSQHLNATAAELAAIKKYQPIHNISGNPRYGQGSVA